MRERIIAVGPDNTVRTMRCPCCDAELDGMAQVVTIDENGVDRWCGPEDGVISVCVICAGVAVFERGQLRQPTPAERAELDKANDVVVARVSVIRFRAEGLG